MKQRTMKQRAIKQRTMGQRTIKQRATSNQPVLPIGNAKNGNLQQIAFVQEKPSLKIALNGLIQTIAE
jgi:hypothetical protein